MLRLPAPLGRYLLVDKIASGGMAEIFKAKLLGVEGFEKTVVIKRILPYWSERRDFVAMLIDEAKILVHLNHPNIVQVFELGCEEGAYFIAMEYVEGIDLRHLMQKVKESGCGIPPEISVELIRQALKGLHYAHHRSLKDKGLLKIVHRDVSPQNILLSFEGEVKVTDFGIAKAMTQTHETQTGVLKGKYAYMSPEQAVGQPLDGRSDLFSCGVVLYEMLFQERLFASASDLETLDKVRQATIPWPGDKITSLPKGLFAVLKQSLALKPEDRFQTAEELAEALETCLSPGQRKSQRDLVDFLRQLMPEEIRERRIHELEVANRTRSYLRETRVSEPSSEDTVSVVETKTETNASSPEENPVITASFARPPKKKYYRWAASLSLLALFPLLVFWWREKDSESTSSPKLPVLASIPTPVTMPLEEKPAAGSLILEAEPPQALITVTYPGGKAQGKRSLEVKELPVGTEAKAIVQLANYETENKSFLISQDQLNVSHVFRLRKKAPGFGGISINAVPWGRVSMAGILGGNETPVSRGKIPEGSYRVTVTNPSLKKTVSATANIKAGRTTRCHADLEGRGTMYCR